MPFANDRIPRGSTDPTGAKLTDFLATLGPGGEISTSGIQIVKAIQTTGNLSHSFSESWQLSGTYLYYRSQEPLFGHYRDLLNTDTSPVFGIDSSTLGRNVHAVAVNNTFMPSAGSVLTLRYGQTYFNDSWSSPVFGKGEISSQLGLQGSFVDKIYDQEGYEGQFPKISVADFGDSGDTHGGRSNDDVQWLSREVSGTYGLLVGNHTLKFGGQWRRLGLHTVNYGYGLTLNFAKKFTQGPDPARPETGSGSALADLLLGIPDSGTATLAVPADLFLDYFGGFFQDDWRATSRLVLNLGLRVEHETGLHEDTHDFAVGWDRENTFPVQVNLPPELDGTLPGFPLKGGLMYAGLDGNPTHQWNPPPIKLGAAAWLRLQPERQDGAARGVCGLLGTIRHPAWHRCIRDRNIRLYRRYQLVGERRRNHTSRGDRLKPLPAGDSRSRGKRERPPAEHRRRRVLQRPVPRLAAYQQMVARPSAGDWEGRGRKGRIRGQPGNQPADRRHAQLGSQHQPACRSVLGARRSAE